MIRTDKSIIEQGINEFNKGSYHLELSEEYKSEYDRISKIFDHISSLDGYTYKPLIDDTIISLSINYFKKGAEHLKKALQFNKYYEQYLTSDSMNSGTYDQLLRKAEQDHRQNGDQMANHLGRAIDIMLKALVCIYYKNPDEVITGHKQIENINLLRDKMPQYPNLKTIADTLDDIETNCQLIQKYITSADYEGLSIIYKYQTDKLFELASNLRKYGGERGLTDFDNYREDKL